MATDWKQLVRQIQPQAALFRPAWETEIVAAEQAVGCRFPEDLRSLLSQTNGASDEWGYGPIRSLAGIIEYTLFIRSIDLANEYDGRKIPMDKFVIIGTDPGGGQYGFFSEPERGIGFNYFEHEAGVFEMEAYSLEQYLRYYYKTITRTCPF